MAEKKRDALGHWEGCAHYDEHAAPSADPNSAYVDMFCDCHDIPLPEVGANGTDVIWPAGWTEPEARYWRAWRGILRPGDIAPEVCPRCKGEGWVCENHPEQPYTAAHNDGEGAPCPVSNAYAYPSDNDGDQHPQPVGPTWVRADGSPVAA